MLFGMDSILGYNEVFLDLPITYPDGVPVKLIPLEITDETEVNYLLMRHVY